AGQRTALAELHREKGQVAVHPEVEHPDDPWVLDRRYRLRFCQETQPLLSRGETPSQDHLQGDGTVELNLPRQVDDAYASAPQLLQDLVAGPPGRAGHFSRRPLPGGWLYRRVVALEVAMQLDLLPQPPGVLGKAPQVFLQRRPFAALFAQQELAVSQLDD